MGRLRTIALRSLGAGAALGLAVVLNFTPGTATPAKAQPAPSTSGLYCAPGLVYVGGFCVRDLGFVPTPDLCPPGFGPVSFGRLAGCGGASSAAFASQALSGIVRTTSQEATDLVLDRLRERRERERNRRLGQFSEFARMNWAADMPGARPVPIEAATPVSAVQPAVWAQAFGEFENRDSLQVAALNQRVQIIDTSSRTRTGGIIGGADVTIGNALTPNDALVLGITSGFQSSTTKFRGSQSEQQLDVSSIGVYGGYVIGGLSLGLTAKADFVELDSTFADFLNSAPFGPVVGSFETDGHNASLGGSLGYRFELASTGWFVEPTVGLDYTRSRFDDAAELGLTNGSTLRGRAGATVGTVWFLNETTAVQPTLGAFAFSDLEVDNEILTFGANGLNPIQSDEGKVRGELQASMNMIFANGLAVFTRAEYRFGEDLQGGTVRAGLRYQF
jgi:outer membrane autotransporter protein